MTDYNPRPHQAEILAYTQGTMGISAVPGSGKTWTLSALAAKLIAEGFLEPDQEILIVTLTNSAVDNFALRIENFLSDQPYRPLIPRYRVRTLHGLAHDLVRERPELAGLDTDFQIIDEHAANSIRNEIATAWIRANPFALDNFLDPALEEGRRDWVRREKLPELVQSIALGFIRTAKDMRVAPEMISRQLENLPLPLPLAAMGAAMYSDYQRALAYRGAVDFDDLIRMALQILELDQELLNRLRQRWPYILEDEAQDSSQLQEQILRQLAGAQGNWVRVGDPNQAIFESFTTANPRFLREFMRTCQQPRKLPNSGRSTTSVIALANTLIDWTREAHPLPEVRDALDLPYIEPTPPDDPQPNPSDRPDQIYLVPTKFGPQSELEAVADSIERWLQVQQEKPLEQQDTIAVLVPRNTRGFALRDLLVQRGIEVIDSLLRSSSQTRMAAGALGNLLNYLADPQNPRKLARVYEVWLRAEREDAQLWAVVEASARLIAQIPFVEDFIWPLPERDWLTNSLLAEQQPQVYERLAEFRQRVQVWQGAVLLPIDQMVLTLAQDLFTEPTDLAIAHKLAVVLRQAENGNPEWRLPELAGELAVIAKNERRFLGFSNDDSGFDPDRYRGKVVISTMHKAKGLEWDRVYLISVNNYDFPSGQPNDSYISEKWFVRQQLNLEAETLAQLETAFQHSDYEWYQEGQATDTARMDYVRERLRLFYVGITRARKELVVTWNSGRKGELTPSLPFEALQIEWNRD